MKKIKNWKSFNETNEPSFEETEGSLNDRELDSELVGYKAEKMKRKFSEAGKQAGYINSILQGYLECALWTEEELDEYAISDIADESQENAKKDIKEFVEKAGDLLNGLDPEQIGHDLWLTRNGHGAGFWDRGLGEVGDKLTDIAKNMGMKNIEKIDDDFVEIY